MRSIVIGLAGVASICGSAQMQAEAQTKTTASPEIIVTASPLAGARDRFATIVDTVNRDEILQHGGASMADALSQVPGVAGTGFAAGASRPVIRGMDANRVKLLEDGLNSSDVSDIGPDHGVPIDPLSARDIEVVRGAATLRYGSQAIGGVVNAINDRVPMKLPTKDFAAETTAAYGSAANTGEGSALADGKVGQFALHADGFYRTTDNYDTPQGDQPNSFFRGGGYSAGSSYFFGDQDKSHVGAGYIHYDTKYGIPSDTTFIAMKQDKALSKSSIAVNAGPLQTINFDVAYASYEHSEIDPATNDILSTFKNQEWDSRAEALFGKIGPLSGSALGVQYANRRFSALGEGGDYLFPAQTETAAAFAFTEAPLGAINLQAALRGETETIDGTPISGIATSRDFTPISGSLGGLYTVSDAVKLGLTFTSAARAPGQTELFARGPHDGPGTFEIGDPTLKIERANEVEATMRLKHDAFTFEGAVWGAKFDNYIFGALTGRTCDDDGVCVADDSEELRELLYTQRDANFWGFEGKAATDLISTKSGTFGVHGLFDYVKADLADGGGPVPRIQPWRVGAGVDWNSTKFDAGAQAIYTGKRDKLSIGETPTEDFWEIQAQAAWRPLTSQPKFELALVGRNLTDEEQRNAVSLNKDLVLSPGRDIRFVVRNAF